MSPARFIRRTVLLAGLVLAVIANTATTACVQPPSGMVAWYPLDEPTGFTAINDIAPTPSSTINNFGTSKPGPVGQEATLSNPSTSKEVLD